MSSPSKPLILCNPNLEAYTNPRSMEFFSNQTHVYLTLSSIFFLLLLLLPFTANASSTATSGTIQRTIKQQILATIEPNSDQNSDPILTSPSGNYAMYFIRHGTAPGAGGFGGDFCYIQVRDTSSGQSLWESECVPMSTANTCTLVFSDQGLEVFDGSRSAWDTGVDVSVHLEILELVDKGDMRIRDKNGDLVWKASDDPRANQECGSPGSPGMTSALPPFASPVDTGTNQNFGLPAAPSGETPEQLPFGNSEQQPFGFQQQHQGDIQSGLGRPLVDNTPFDSGNSMVVVSFGNLVLCLFFSLFADGLLFQIAGQ